MNAAMRFEPLALGSLSCAEELGLGVADLARIAGVAIYAGG